MVAVKLYSVLMHLSFVAVQLDSVVLQLTLVGLGGGADLPPL